MTNKFKISQAADFLGVSTKTLRRWDAAGHLTPQRTAGGQRYYTRTQLENAIRQGETLKGAKRASEGGSHPISAVPSFDYSSSFNAVAGKQYQEAKALEEVQQETLQGVPLLRQGDPLKKLAIGQHSLARVFSRSLAFATVMSLLLFVYDVSGFWGRSYARGLPAVAKKATSFALKGWPYEGAEGGKISQGDPLHTQGSPLTTSQVLAATDVNLPFHFAVDVPAIFSEDITAPNVIYSITAGDGITITGDQDLTISGSANSWLKMKVGSTTLSASGTSDTFEYVAGGSVSLALDTTNKKLTITGSTDASTLDSLDSTAFLRADTSDSYTSGTLTFSDGTFLDLSAILQDDTAAQGLKLPQNTSLTAPSTGEGFIAYNTTDNQLYVFNGTSWGASGNWTLNGTDLYASSITYDVGIGTTAPAYDLDVVGTLQITGSGFTGLRMPTGSEENYVLTTDGEGNASWTDTTGGGAFGAWTLTGSTIYPNSTSYNLVLGSTSVLDSVAKLVNTGSTLYKPLSVADLPTGGAIGTAATTVDIYTTFNVTQTTASQTITLPDPTSAMAGRLVYVANTGSTPFTLLGSVVTAGTTTQVMWNGTAWTLTGANSGVPAGTTNNATMRWNTATSTWQENTSILGASTGNLAITGTSEQLRLAYDASNYMAFTIGSTGNLVLSDSGTTVATLGSEQASFNVPTEFTAAGDVAMAYDLVFTNQSTAGIYSYGPMIIESGESFENNNLTLKTYGTGDVFLDMGGNLLLQSADPAIVFDTTTATDTDFWMGVTEDAGGDDDDIFSIGKGVGIGTSAYFNIAQTGYVGLGTTSPATLLSLGSTTYTFAAQGLSFGDMDTGLYEISDDLFAIRTAATDRMVVGATGNVGIGLTNPSTPLNIYHSASPSIGLSNSDNYNFRIISSGGSLYFQKSNVNFGTNTNSLIINGSTTYNVTGYSFYTGNESTSSEKIRIDSSGNLGIGTTIPATKLAVAGGVGIGTTDSFANAAIAANNLAVQGNIGIGVTAPGDRLTIDTPSSTTSSIFFKDANQFSYGAKITYSESANQLRISGWDTDAEVLGLALNRATGYIGLGTTAPAARLGVVGGVGIGTTDSFANAAIAANNLAVQGSVGIGTTSPDKNLTISAGNPSIHLYDMATPVSNGYIYFSDPTHDKQEYIKASPSSAALSFYTGNQERLQIKGSTGVVFNDGSYDVDFRIESNNDTHQFFVNAGDDTIGIGTSAPATKLAIAGGVGIGTTDSFANAAVAANNLAVQGSVGIGVTAPQYPLHVSGNAYASALYLAQANSAVYTSATMLRLTGQNGIQLESGGVGKAYLTTNGLGIGTTVPATALGVVGGVGIGTTDSFANAAIAANQLAVQGRIGIGITNPSSALQITNNPGLGNETQKAALVVDQYENQDLLTASASGTTKFAVSSAGTVYMGDNTTLGTSTAVCWEAATLNNDDAVFKLGDCTGTPADLAEMYPARKLETLNSNLETVSDFGFSASDLPEAAEIVSIAESLGTYTTSDGVTHQSFAVEKATKDTAHKMAGIVSTKAWQVIGEDVLDWAESAVPVALTGRVPVKIAVSSPAITAGDMITISDDIPGAGKKSDGNGYIIGKALEDWNNDKETILVFLQNSVNIAGVLEDTRVTNLEAEVELLKAASLISQGSHPTTQGDAFLTADDLSIQNLSVLSSSVLGDVTITGGLTIASLSDININNNIIIDQKGNLSIKEGQILGNASFRGKIELISGQTEVNVTRIWDNPPETINVNTSWFTNTAVVNVTSSGFTVRFATPPSQNETLFWVAVF